MACLLAVGVNAEGHREIIGVDVGTTEDSAGRLALFRSLVARGHSGAELVISDDHPGLTNAIAAIMAGASWQRCRTHYLRNLLTKVPKSSEAIVATMVPTIFTQPDPSRCGPSIAEWSTTSPTSVSRVPLITSIRPPL